MGATTITVDAAVRDRLKAFGGGSYTDKLVRLMDEVEKNAVLTQWAKEIDDPSTVWIAHEDIEWD